MDWWSSEKCTRASYINKKLSKLDLKKRNLKTIPELIFIGNIVDELTIYVTAMIPKYDYIQTHIPIEPIDE